MGAAPDDGVWRYARENGFTIVTKDADYHERSLIGGYPPKVIRVRRGNSTTAEIEAILRSHREAIDRLDAEPGLAVLIL